MAEHYKVELGRAIRQRREELGLTQKQLADRTNHQEAQTVSRWERGENAPADLEVVADALEWTLAELVAGIEAPSPRTARKLGHVPTEGVSQLDRIENLLDRNFTLLNEILDRLVADGVLRAVAQDAQPAPPSAPAARRRRAS